MTTRSYRPLSSSLADPAEVGDRLLRPGGLAGDVELDEVPFHRAALGASSRADVLSASVAIIMPSEGMDCQAGARVRLGGTGRCSGPVRG